MELRVLTHDDFRQALPMADAIEAMADAYRQLSDEQAQVPLRGRLSVEKQEGVTLLMPAFLPQTEDMAVKIVSVFPKNRDRELPTIHAVVLTLDPSTGQPTALIEGSSLTALRTGAASGLATKILARPEANSVGIFGAGVQARTQLEAVCTARHIQQAMVYSPIREEALTFAEDMAGQDPIPGEIIVAGSPDELLEADVICTATTSHQPVFPGDQLQPGVHINAIGAFTPDMEEVDVTTLKRSTIYVDSRSAVLEEAGDLIGPIRRNELTPDDIFAEIGEVVSGKAQGRTSPDQITYFKSVGVAVQDAVAAGRALKRAQKMDIGSVVEL